MSRSGYDRYISVFSPEGKLYQVEYAHKAVKHCGITSIAIQGGNCAVVISQKKVPDKLMKPESVTNVFRIAADIGVSVTGRTADIFPVVTQARRVAAEYTKQTGEPCPVSHVAHTMASKAQFATQNAGVRLMGLTLHFFSMELTDEGTFVPRIFRVDPSGYCMQHYASAAGAKDTEAVHFLEKRQKEVAFSKLESVEAVAKLGLACLQTVLNESLKARDVEVGFVEYNPQDSAANTDSVSTSLGLKHLTYQVATSDCVEAWLTQLAERE